MKCGGLTVAPGFNIKVGLKHDISVSEIKKLHRASVSSTPSKRILTSMALSAEDLSYDYFFYLS